MIEEENQMLIGDLCLHYFKIENEEWFRISSFIYKYSPNFSFSFFLKEKSTNLYQKIPKNWQTLFTNQYIFKRELLLELLSTIPVIAHFFIKNYFLSNQPALLVNQIIKKIGRPEKPLSEVKSNSRKRERRKIFEENFEKEHKFSFNQYLYEYKIVQSFIMQNDTCDITQKLIKKDYPEYELIKKVQKKDILYWKDKNLISFDKIENLKIDLNLNKIIPCKSTIHSFKKALNSLIIKRYNIKIKENAIIIENIKQLLIDYIKFIDMEDIMIKWTSDERKMKKNIGNVGVSFITTNCRNLKTQSPDNYMYICIGNGKETNEFFETHLSDFKSNLNLIMIDGKIIIGNKTLNNFFVSDLKHIWENCSITPFSSNKITPIDKLKLDDEFTRLVKESQSIFDQLGPDDIELNLNTDYELDPKRLCCFCGKNLRQIRNSTWKEEKDREEEKRKSLPPVLDLSKGDGEENREESPLSLKTYHWLGMEVKGFCSLHFDQRCFERILYYFGRNDEQKINQIVQTFLRFGLVRDGWKYSKKGKIFLPKMLKGTEIIKICDNYKLWKNCFDWIIKEEKQIIKSYLKVLPLLHLESHQVSFTQIEMNKHRTEVNNFIRNLINLYGKKSIQYYLHFLDFHVLEILSKGITFPTISQQGFEHSHYLHKRIQNQMTSNDSGKHKTPSFVQILFRQMRIFVVDNEIFGNDEILEEERNQRS